MIQSFQLFSLRLLTTAIDEPNEFFSAVCTGSHAQPIARKFPPKIPVRALLDYPFLFKSIDGSTDHTRTSGEPFISLYQPVADGVTLNPDIPIGVVGFPPLFPEEISHSLAGGKSR